MFFLPVNRISIKLFPSSLCGRIYCSTIGTINDLLSPKVIAPEKNCNKFAKVDLLICKKKKKTYVIVSEPPANNSKSISSPSSAIKMTAVTAPGTSADFTVALKRPYCIYEVALNVKPFPSYLL